LTLTNSVPLSVWKPQRIHSNFRFCKLLNQTFGGSYQACYTNVGSSTRVAVRAWNNNWRGIASLPPPVKPESRHMHYTVSVRLKTQSINQSIKLSINQTNKQTNKRTKLSLNQSLSSLESVVYHHTYNCHVYHYSIVPKE
jgi:hypothetical protein